MIQIKESPIWVRNEYLDFVQHLKPNYIEQVNHKYYGALCEQVPLVLSTMDQNYENLEVDLIPVYTQDATTCALHKGDKYAIIYDVHQVVQIRQLFQYIIGGWSQDQVFPFLKEFIASKLLAEGSGTIALALRDEPVSKLYTRCIYDHEKLFNHSMELFHNLPKVVISDFSPCIDAYILAHELYHILSFKNTSDLSLYQSKAKSWYEHYANEYINTDFEAYKEHFVKILKLNGVKDLNFNEEKLHNLWSEKVSQFKAEEKQITEELAADFFALQYTTNFYLTNAHSGFFKFSMEDMFCSISLTSQILHFLFILSNWTKSISESPLSVKPYSDHSTSLYSRNLAIGSFSKLIVTTLSEKTMRIKRFDLTDEKRLNFKEIENRIAANQIYFSKYIGEPSITPIEMTIKAAIHKLKDPDIAVFYSDVAEDFSFRDMAFYVNPVIENFSLSHLHKPGY